ncbi:MAG: DUF3303 family protein [Oleispira sp.]
MLFLIYWELNEQVAASQRIAALNKMQAAGLFPPPDAEIIRFDITPGQWGSTVMEADSSGAIMRHLGAWRIACPGIFVTTKVSPAMSVADSVAEMMDVLKKLD